jgi:hypothetical protein
MPRDRWAISRPLATVKDGQPRLLRSIRVSSSAALTAVCHTPSKLVMRVRFPSPAPGIYPRVSGCSPLRLRGGCGARSIVHATHVPHVYTARGPVTRGQAKNCVMPGRRRAADYLTSRVKRGAAVRRRWRALHRAPACGPTARLLTGGEDSRRGVGDPLRRGCQRRRTLSACSSFAGSSPYTATTLGWPAVAA